jgi:hypothetical protein
MTTWRRVSQATTRGFVALISLVHSQPDSQPYQAASEPIHRPTPGTPLPQARSVTAGQRFLPDQNASRTPDGAQYRGATGRPGADHERTEEHDRPEEEPPRARSERRGHTETDAQTTRLAGTPKPQPRPGQTDSIADRRRRPEAQRRRR